MLAPQSLVTVLLPFFDKYHTCIEQDTHKIHALVTTSLHSACVRTMYVQHLNPHVHVHACTLCAHDKLPHNHSLTTRNMYMGNGQAQASVVHEYKADSTT